MKKLRIILGSALAIFVITSVIDFCGDSQRNMSGNYIYETACMGFNIDGFK